MGYSFRWSLFILFFALLVPVDLPAGGSIKKYSNIIQYQKSNSYYANDDCFLRSSPSLDGLFLRYVPLGTPLRLVRSWKSEDGNNWLQVQISSLDILSNTVLPIRGWINV